MFPISHSQLTFTSGGKPIRIDCFSPEAAGRRFPAILGLHGSGGDFEGMQRPAALLAAQGFAVYVLHYFDRTGTSAAKDRATIFRHFFAWAKTVWDATSFVAAQPQVDPERLGLLGFSLGAYLALSNASVDPRIQAVVEFFGGLPKEMKLFMRRLCPVLILHGDSDATVPVAEAYHLQQVLESRGIACEMKIYPGAGHHFSDEVWRDAGQRTLAFFQKYLGGETSVPRAPSAL
ncbi:MAG TPA: dienelactone hydrolase family protein [Terriglobales bacterium]|nr:dienelactone hydrolase family protein [Terriglobales bacterium]